jgi:hypothetical protein
MVYLKCNVSFALLCFVTARYPGPDVSVACSAAGSAQVPPNFAVLLQMREMLGIKTETAEAIEVDVMQAEAAFSI